MMAAGPLIGYFIGDFLDKKLGTEPFLMILMIALGLVSSAEETYKLIKRTQEEEDD